jgi:ATP-dependent RNA helicase DDX54/DBP10
MLCPRAGGYHKGNKKFPGAGRGCRSIPNADVPSEIRNPDQMQKGRHEKVKEISRLKNKSAKDGKFPNKFQRNGDGKGRGSGRLGGHGKVGRALGKETGKGPVKGEEGRVK